MLHPFPVVKTLLALLVLSLPMIVRAKDDVARDPVREKKEEKVAQDPLTIRALARLEQRMDIKFNIPFPANFDTDAYRKRPLAVILIDGSKLLVSRPIVNPYDEPRTVEFMIGPADPARLPNEGVDCSFDLDERGEFSRLNLLVDWAADGKSTHLLDRGEGESGADFFERARLTYRFRAKKAKDPAQAALFLTAFEKMARAIHALRKEEARTVLAIPPQ
jgi:hypothetical protein